MKSQCKFCKRTSHLGAACRQKKAKDEGGPSGEVSFFHGGYSCVAELEDCDSHHGHLVSKHEFCPSDFSLGSCMLGELELFPSTLPLAESILPIQINNRAKPWQQIQ